MRLEQRGRVKPLHSASNWQQEEADECSKTVHHRQRLVYEAFKAVKANAGAAGVDKQTIEDFETDLKDNLYRIWNRMSSGSYFPPPVKAVAIPKKNGGERILGVPTVADRVAQMVVKRDLEPDRGTDLSAGFLWLSARQVRARCRGGDARSVAGGMTGFWSSTSRVCSTTSTTRCSYGRSRSTRQCEWVRLYIERWLTAPLQLTDGTLVQRTKGTPQGGVVSPVLANLFLHYAFDVWMTRTYPGVPWCRYADDGLVHCRTEQEAQAIMAALSARLAECGFRCIRTRRRSSTAGTEVARRGIRTRRSTSSGTPSGRGS